LHVILRDVPQKTAVELSPVREDEIRDDLTQPVRGVVKGGLELDISEKKKCHLESTKPVRTEMRKFLFGEPNGAHEIICASDRNAAIWRFLMKITSLWDYVPERYRKTDPEGHWVGHYDGHSDMFLPEYSPDACIPVFVRVETEWKPTESISPYNVGTDKCGSDSIAT
jgi:hypothetical protein